MNGTIFPDSLSGRSLFGAQPHHDGVSFSLFSRNATKVHLMVFDHPEADRPLVEVEMHRFADVWHFDSRDARPGMFYCYRIEDEKGQGGDQWLLDPFAKAISWPTGWADTSIEEPGIFPRFGNAFPKGIITENNFDWGDDKKPEVPWEDMLIYEAHVRGFTKDPSAEVSAPGTYDGFIEKLPHLQSLGVTSIELLPIYEFNEREYHYAGDKRKDLCNFWGYSTVGFFAPQGRYAADGRHGQQVNEFKRLIKAIHEHGMEVILDVVYNHTAENGPDDITYSFKGIDERIYYSMTEAGHYRNFSGCGNTVNCNHPTVRDFIIDSLRHWVTEYHIDGFRFDLASVFCRGENARLLKQPPIIERIDHDPILHHTKMIAEAWDCSTYLVGQWPSARWAEWNGKYRDDIRRFWKADDGMISDFATRLTGSDDLYRKDNWMQKSINFITCHDGMTLADLVSYNHKHNEANHEENRDGTNDNHSYNYGIEGPTENVAINTIRLQQQKNMIATLMLSQGIPMLLGGDEFGRTQGGSNNAYCQDNTISWVNWELANTHADLLEFTRECIALRSRQANLRRTTFFGPSDPAIHWHGIEGRNVVWESDKALACWLSGDAEHTGASSDCLELFMIFNPDLVALNFILPENLAAKVSSAWQLEIASANIKHSGTLVTMPPRSMAVFAREGAASA